MRESERVHETNKKKKRCDQEMRGKEIGWCGKEYNKELNVKSRAGMNETAPFFLSQIF